MNKKKLTISITFIGQVKRTSLKELNIDCWCGLKTQRTITNDVEFATIWYECPQCSKKADIRFSPNRVNISPWEKK